MLSLLVLAVWLRLLLLGGRRDTALGGALGALVAVWLALLIMAVIRSRWSVSSALAGGCGGGSPPTGCRRSGPAEHESERTPPPTRQTFTGYGSIDLSGPQGPATTTEEHDMSAETSTWLNQNILVGDGRQAWHFNEAAQGAEPNHYEGAIPVADVARRLFDWDVVESPVTVTVLTDSGQMVTTETKHKVRTRSDNGGLLGVVGVDNKAHGYKEWLLDSWGKILDSDEVHVSNAGLLRGGAQAFVQIARPDFIVAAGVEFRPFLLATTSLDANMSSTFKTATTVTVCDNTLEMALREKGNVHRTRHTSQSTLNVPSIQQALGILHSQEAGFAAEVERLVAEEVGQIRFMRWADAFAGVTDEKRAKGGRGLTIAENKRAQIINLWNDDERVTPWKGTAFGVLQAANTWMHHLQGGLGEGTSREERNVSRVIDGTTAAADREALRLLALV